MSTVGLPVDVGPKYIEVMVNICIVIRIGF